MPRDWFEAFVKILAPFAPHVAEEMWQRLGHTQGISFEPWPVRDEAKLARDTIMIAVQVNGKLRGQITVAADAAEDAKEIYVKGRLVNLVV